MTPSDTDHDLAPDDPRRLAIIAYARFSILPANGNGTKSTPSESMWYA